MKLKLMLLTASALGLCMGAAWAGSNNTLYISQSGDANQASVSQGAGSNSDIGQTGAGGEVTQDGTSNRLSFAVTTWGTNNNVDITALRQHGTKNMFEEQAAGGSSNNVLGNSLQDGTNNSTRVAITNNSNSSIGSISAVGNNNAVSIYQGSGLAAPSSNNHVGTVSIVGNNNGIGWNYPYAHGDWGAAVYIQQIGTGNTVAESTIEGSNNHDTAPYAAGAFNRVHEIIQAGIGNGSILATAVTKGSNENWISVNQNGSANQFDVRQGTDANSTQNFVTLDQVGVGNTATVAQTGSYNTASLTFTGDRNGSQNATGMQAASFAAGFNDRGLTQGTVTQANTGASTNLVAYNVLGNDNLFAFKQLGSGNTIDGHVGSASASSNNQVAVLQSGNNNTSAFSQTGVGNNSLSVSQ
jgi:hypothetical protein